VGRRPASHARRRRFGARLHDKGAVRRERTGRAYAYTPVLDEAGLAARRMRAMLDRGGDHDAVLTRFLGTLSADQQRTLARLLRRLPGAKEG
jgi:predicted transcriptional regulator